jgi:hypothetical protein
MRMDRNVRLDALVTCGLFVTSCAGYESDIPSTIRFAELTDAQVTRLAYAATGSEGVGAMDRAQAFSNNRTCPASKLVGDLVTIDGGCSTDGGDAISGRITIENAFTWPEYRTKPDDDTLFVFHQFAVMGARGHTVVDGWYRQRGWRSSAKIIELDFTNDGETVRTELFIDEDPPLNTIEGGVELVGIGGARVSGTRDATAYEPSRYTLTGVDTLELTLSVDGKAPVWRIIGTDRACTIEYVLPDGIACAQ